jgi:hypothetical protein
MVGWLAKRWKRRAGAVPTVALTPAEQTQLRSLAEALNRNPRANARLSSPASGSASDFAAVRAYLIELGVEGSRLTLSTEASEGTSAT